MPWNNVQGKVIRTNPDFTGPTVWSEDQQAGIKIIATRHDIHDQDLADSISATLHTGGYNKMLANIDINGFKVINLIPGVDDTDSVNMAQQNALADLVQTNTDDIAAIETSSPDNAITGMTWDGSILELIRVNPNFTVNMNFHTEFKNDGSIRHSTEVVQGATNVTLDAESTCRFFLDNDVAGTLNITITKPTGIDDDLGEEYWTEGMVVIQNGALFSTPILVGVAPQDIIGSPSATLDVRYVLSWMILRQAGDVYLETYVWSSAP